MLKLFLNNLRITKKFNLIKFFISIIYLYIIISFVSISSINNNNIGIDLKINYKNFNFYNISNFALSKDEIEELRIMWSKEDLRLEDLGYLKYSKIRIGEHNLKERPFPAHYIQDPELRKYVEDLIIKEKKEKQKYKKVKNFEEEWKEFKRQVLMLYYSFGSFAAYAIGFLLIILWSFIKFSSPGAGKWSFIIFGGSGLKYSYLSFLIWKICNSIYLLGLELNLGIICWYGLITLFITLIGSLIITFIIPLYHYFLKRSIRIFFIYWNLYFRKIIFYTFYYYSKTSKFYKKYQNLLQKIKNFFFLKFIALRKIIKFFYFLKRVKTLSILKRINFKNFNFIKKYEYLKWFIFFKKFNFKKFLLKIFNFFFFLSQIFILKIIKSKLINSYYIINNKLFLLAEKFFFLNNKIYGEYSNIRKINFFFKRRFQYFFFIKLNIKIYWKLLDKNFNITLQFTKLFWFLIKNSNKFFKYIKLNYKLVLYLGFFIFALFISIKLFSLFNYYFYLIQLKHRLAWSIVDMTIFFIGLICFLWIFNKKTKYNLLLTNNIRLTFSFLNKFKVNSLILFSRYLFFYFWYMCFGWPIILKEGYLIEDLGKEIKIDILINTNIISYANNPVLILYTYSIYCFLYSVILYLFLYLFYYSFIAQKRYKEAWKSWNRHLLIEGFKKSFSIYYFRFLKVEEFNIRFFRYQHKIFNMIKINNKKDELLGSFIEDFIDYNKIDESIGGKIEALSFNTEKNTKLLINIFNYKENFFHKNFILSYRKFSIFFEFNWLKRLSYTNNQPNLGYNKLLAKRSDINFDYYKIFKLDKGYTFFLKNPEHFLWKDNKYYKQKKFFKFLVREKNKFWLKDYFFDLFDRHIIVRNKLYRYNKLNQFGFFLTLFIIPMFAVIFYKVFCLLLIILKYLWPYLIKVYNIFSPIIIPLYIKLKKMFSIINIFF